MTQPSAAQKFCKVRIRPWKEFFGSICGRISVMRGLSGQMRRKVVGCQVGVNEIERGAD
jgi:hypothetical protein